MKRNYCKQKSRYDYEESFIDDLYNEYIQGDGEESFDDFVDRCYDEYCESFQSAYEDETEYHYLRVFL